MGKIFHLKSNFEEFSGEKTRIFLPFEVFLSCVAMSVYRTALIPIKLPCPENWLVAKFFNLTKINLFSFAEVVWSLTIISYCYKKYDGM